MSDYEGQLSMHYSQSSKHLCGHARACADTRRHTWTAFRRLSMVKELAIRAGLSELIGCGRADYIMLKQKRQA